MKDHLEIINFFLKHHHIKDEWTLKEIASNLYIRPHLVSGCLVYLQTRGLITKNRKGDTLYYRLNM